MYTSLGWILAYVIFTISVHTLTVASGLTQPQLDVLAENLHVQAEVLDNLLHNAVSHNVRLTFENTGNVPVPSAGWILYFHSMYLLFPEVFPKNMSKVLDIGNMKVNMIQGDFYSMEPLDGFVQMAPHDRRDFIIEAAVWSVSRTDFMPHWYLVSTDDSVEPRILQATNSMNLEYVQPMDDFRQWKRFNFDTYNPYTTQERMRRLSVDNTGKVEKLIIPTPKDINTEEGATLTVDNATWAIYNVSTEASNAARYLSRLTNLPQNQTERNQNVIILKITPNGTVPEAYTIDINPAQKTIVLEGRDADGLFNAVQSLYSILTGYSSREIPKISISDEPRFRYRGMYVDVARNFHKVADLKRLMNIMAMYKLNKLHIHLGDDEGWRLEIADLPELTEVGGRRCHDLQESQCIIPQFGSGPFTNSSGSGFYTVSDYKDILNYAVERHIEVIPEFDMPVHAHAAIASMEARYRNLSASGNETAANEFRLIDPDDKSVYISVQQWMDNAINPCLESTYNFIGKVIDQMIELHKDIQPLKTYHFGGDEVAGGAWESSPRCHELYNHYPEYNVTKGLKRYFAEKVSNLTSARGVGMRGWEDGYMDKDGNPFPLETMGNTDMSANAWDNVWEWGAAQRAYTLANAGYKVVMSQATLLYFDHPYEPDPEERGLYWATRFTDTLKTFSFLPDTLYDNIKEQRSGQPLSKKDVCGEDMSKCAALKKKGNVIGMQGHLWSETVRTSENMDYMIFPRMLAIAERAWHKADFEEDGISAEEREQRMKLDWQAFANTLGHKELLRLDTEGVKYRVPPPGGRVENGTVIVSTTFPGLEIQYSRDGGGNWSSITDQSQLTWQAGTLHLRTISADKKRFSRVVQLFEEEPVPSTIQPVVDYIADNIEVYVAVIDNLNKDNDYVKMDLKLKNNGNMDITTGTWKIYFYSLYDARSEALPCGMTVGHVNGALFYFTPTDKTFQGVKAGQTLECIYYNKNWNVARTDHMPNWYVGSAGMVAKTIKTTVNETLSFVGPFDTAKKWKRAKEDKFDPYTSERRYELYDTDMVDTDLKNGIVVPTPHNVSIEDTSLRVTAEAGWVVVNSAYFKFEAKYLAGKLKIPLADSNPVDKYITFLNEQLEENDPDAYHLSVDPAINVTTILAHDRRGGLHGAQTLISLLEGNGGELNKMTIKDKPRFGYRGVMLDAARNFKPKAWILKFLDVMSMYKLNTLHFHLTEDEAWRIEIPGLPELTELAARQCQSDYTDSCVIPQLGSGPDSTTSGSGFYSVQDYRDILKYANDRHIQVIPEVESPGHAAAAISAMAYRESKLNELKSHGSADNMESMLLSDESLQNGVESVHKWKRSSMSPCLNSTYAFMNKVIEGFVELHKPVVPLKIFHIGGDEVPEGVWAESPACHAMMNTDGVGHADLQRMFVKRVADIVASHDLNLAAWEDGVYADNKPNPITDYNSTEVYAYPWSNRWETNKAQRSSEFADAGYKVVLPLATHLYFDQPYEPDPEERGLYWAARVTDTRKVFGLMPDNIFANADVTRMGDPVDLKDICHNKPCPMPNKTENIVGIEACLFSETMRTEEQFHYMGFPRILALAERAWHKASWEDNDDIGVRNKQREQDWESFANTLGYKELPRLEKNGIYYRVPPPGAKIEDSKLKVNTRYPQHEVDYSTDGGKSWQHLKEDRFLRPDSYTIHLRSRSKELNRVSRVIEFKTSVVSAAATIYSVYILAAVIPLVNAVSYMVKVW